MTENQADSQFEKELDEAEEYLRAYITCCLDNPNCAEVLAPPRADSDTPTADGGLYSVFTGGSWFVAPAAAVS